MSKDLYQKAYFVTINTDPKENYSFSEKNEFLETHYLNIDEACWCLEKCTSGKEHFHMSVKLHHKMRSDNLRRSIGATMNIQKVDSISVNIRCIYNVHGLYNTYAYMSKELINPVHKLGNVNEKLYETHCNNYLAVKEVGEKFKPLKKKEFMNLLLVRSMSEDTDIDSALHELYDEGYYLLDLKVPYIIHNFQWMKREIPVEWGLQGFAEMSLGIDGAQR